MEREEINSEFSDIRLRKLQLPKHWDDNDKDDDNSLNINIVYNDNSESQKFKPKLLIIS